MANSDNTEESIEIKLKKAMGNVLPTSGGQDNSLVSSDPFRYSELGKATSHSLADAMSKVHLDIEDAILKFKLDTGQSFWNSINEEMKNQENKLLEYTKVSINDELRKVAKNIAEQSSVLGNQGIRIQIEDQQRKLLEQAKISITDELKKFAERIQKERPIQLSAEKFQSTWNRFDKEAMRIQIEDQQRKLLEQVSKSLSKSIYEATKKNITDKDRWSIKTSEDLK